MSLRIDSSIATRWASATFIGARHTLAILVPDTSQGRRWIAALPEADLPLRSHLVADLAIEHVRYAQGQIFAGIAVLTVEDR